MRYVYSVAALAVLSFFVPAQASAQGLSVTNYRLISAERVNSTFSYYTLAADVVNTGAARSVVTATVTSPVSNLQTVPGAQNLHFSPVPTGQTASLDTFRLLVDTTVPTNYSQLQWTFQAPYAKAGPNQTVPVGQLVTLNGSGSSDPAGIGYLQYSWTFLSRPPGSSVRITDANSVMASFTPDISGGTWIVQLSVSNGVGTDVSTLTVTTGNSAPVANAGPNQTVAPGATVTLNGSASSDVDGDSLTYQWSFVSRPAGSTAVLSSASSLTPTFVVDRPGSYTIQLIVNDGHGHNSVASLVTIATQNTAPVANAGPTQSVSVSTLVHLNGAGSTDVDGDPLTYAWTLITKPAGSTATLSGATLVNPTFTVDLAGTYVAQLVVNDGKVNSVPATVTISTGSVGGPTANAGPNQTVKHHSLVQLNGGLSTDPNSVPLTFQWSLITKPAGSTAALNNSVSATPSFTADLVGTYVAQLIVSNGSQTSAPASVTITTTNTAPVANAGPNQTAAVNSVVTLNGTFSSDADGDAITFAWTFSSKPAGSAATLTGPTSSAPTFVPDVAGTYVVQLIVSDVFASSVPATTTVTAGSNTITLSPDPLTLLSNAPSAMTVTLNQPAPGAGLLVTLLSLAPGTASLPPSVTIPPNSLSTTFLVSPGSNGSTQISASAPGYRPGTATVNVGSPTISVSLSASTVGLSKSVTGTVTLSSPAPTGGTSVGVNPSPAGIVSVTGSPVIIAAGSTTGTFTVTGLAAGFANITASSPGYTSGNTSVTASLLGQIAVEKNVTVTPGETKPIQISLASAAPVGGVVITLTSGTPSAVVVTNTVTIPAGSTTPLSPATVTGVAFGSSLISASASGFTGDSATVVVGSGLSFTPPALNLAAGVTQNLTLTLTGPAPSNMTVNLVSGNTGVATVPASVVILQNNTTVSVPITGVNGGSTTISATAAVPNVLPATAAITVTNSGGIQMPASSSLGLGQAGSLQLSLTSPAPVGGVTISLNNSNPAKVTLSASSVFIAANNTTPAVQPSVTGAAPGSSIITATANGFGSATQTVSVTASFTLTPPTASFPSGSTQVLTLALSAPAPAAGLIANLSSSNPGSASVPSTVSFAPNATSVQFTVNGLVPGSSTITASSTGVTSSSSALTIQNSGAILVSNVSVAPGQSAPFTVTLPSPAVGNTSVAIVSSDPSKVTLSQSSVFILSGNTQPNQQPSVNGVSFGSATISATASGYGPGSGLATVGATMSFVQSNLNLVIGQSPLVQLSLSVSAPAGGLPITLTSSNPSVLSLPGSTNIAQGSGGVSFVINALTGGTTVITASTNVANVAPATLTVTVAGAGGGGGGSITLPSGASVTVGQALTFPVTLSAAAPAGGTVVNLSSSDPTKATISPASVTVLAGQTQPPTQPQVTGVAAGTPTITAAASGYTSATQLLTVVSAGSITITPTLALTVNSSGNLTVTLPSAAPVGGKTVTLTSSNTASVTVPSSITVPQNSTTAQVPVTSLAAGSSTITAVSSGQGQATSTVTVTSAIGIVLPSNFVVGPGASKSFPVTLSSAPAVATTVTLASADDSKVTISPQTIFFNAGQTTPTSQPTANGLIEGTIAITASGSGLTTTSTNVRVGYSISFTPPTLAITGTATQTMTLKLSSQAPSPITVTLSSSNTAVATVPASAFFGAGSDTANVAVTGVSPGTAVISALTPTIPVTTGTVTVTAPNVISVPAITTVSLGKTVAFPVTLPSAAPAGGVTVTLTSADTTKVIAPSSVFIAAGQTQPASQPQLLGENVGDVNVTASASGYVSGVGVVKVGTTVVWQTPNVELAPGQSQVVFIALGASAPGQPPFPGDTGVKINFVSSNPSVVSVRDNITAYPDGSEFTTIALVISAQGPGTATITASGINIPAAVMTVTVGGPLTINTTSLPGGTVGSPYSQTLSGAGGTAPRTWSLTAGVLPNGLQLNSATGLISGTPTVAVVAPLTFRLSDNSSPQQSVTVQLSLTIGIGSGGGASMTLTPSPLNITGTATQNLTLTLSVAAPGGGLVVNLNSSNTGAATVVGTVTVPAGATTVSVPVTGVAAGNAIVTAIANGYGQATANVVVAGGQSTGDIILGTGIVVAPGDFKTFPVTLAVAPSSAVFVLLSVSDPSLATLSQQTVFINAGNTTPTLQPKINGIANGTVTVTATATGLASASTSVLVGFGLSFTPSTTTITGVTTKNETLALTSPTPSALTVSLTSTNPSVATVPPTVTISAGATTANVQVTSVAPGTTDIIASSPGIADAVAHVTVQPPGVINVQPINIGLGVTAALPVSISNPAPFGGLTVSLVSSNPGRVTVPSSVVIPAGQTTPASPVMVTAVNVGPSTITATAPAFITGSADVNVNASVSWLSVNPIIDQGGQQILLLKLSASAPWPVDGGVAVNLTSSNPAIAGIQSIVNFFPDGSEFTTLAINVSGLAPGTSVITAQGLNIPAASVTVTVVGPLTMPAATLPTGSVGLAYSSPVLANGGRTPYTYNVSSANLPGGLSINPATGVISGTPTAAVQNRQLTIQVMDSSNPQQTASGVVTLTISAQAPSSVTVNGASSQTAAVGTQFGNPLSVLVKDTNDLPVPGITVNFAMVPVSGASATFAGGVATAITNGSGIATSAAITANSVIGSYTATAQVSGVGSAATFNLSNVAGPPATVVATGGSVQNTPVSTAFASPLTVTVKDTGINPVSGIVVTFTIPGSGASGTFAGGINTATTDAAGVATSPVFTANATVGSYAITATVPGSGAQATFSLTNTSGPVTSIAATSGTPQNASINANFVLPLKATVKDQGQNPVPGVTVTFTAPISGAGGSFSGANSVAVVTDANGVATSPVFTANTTLGSYAVTATVAGVGSANFPLTNIQGAPASITATNGTPQNVVVNTTFSLPLSATVLDAASNPVPGVTVTFTAPASGATGSFAGLVNTAVTNALGVATSALFTANGTTGTYQVVATAGALPPAFFTLTNNAFVGNLPQITIPSVQVGKGLQATLTVTIPNPAPSGGQRITLTPSDYNLIRVAGRQADAGVAAPLAVTIGEGLTQVTGIFVQGLAASGSAQLVASSPGYTDGTSTVTLFPSGFVISGPNGAAGSFNMFQGATAQLTVQTARLTAAGLFAEVQALKGGVLLIPDPMTGIPAPGPNNSATVTLSNSTPAVGGPGPSSVTIVGGDSSATTTFSALAVGSSTVTADTPANYTTPAGGSNAIVVTVIPSGLVALNSTVGQNLQVATHLNLNSPAPGAGLSVTITSNDPSKVLFSAHGTGDSINDPSLTALTILVPAGRTTSQDFFVQGQQNAGSVSYSITASGYGSANGTVTVTPSGFVLTSPFGRGADFFTTTGAANSDLQVTAARLDAGGNFAEFQALRGGLSVNVPITSSNTTVGTITASPVTIVGPNNSANTQFDPSTAGTTTISVGAPAGFIVPSNSASVNAQVRVPQISVTSLTVGKNLQSSANILLGQAAPSGGLDVTLTSGSVNVLLAPNQSTPGASQIVVHVPQGQSSAFFVVQGFADNGVASYTAQAAGYQSTSGTVTLTHSGIIVSSLFGAGQSITITVAGGNQPLTFSTAMLDSSNNFLSTQPLAAGLSLPLTITNSNPTTGNIAASTTIVGGSSDATVLFTPVTAGTQTTIGVTQPAGYFLPLPAFQSSVLVRVN